MHNYDELVYHGTSFTLNGLNEVNSKAVKMLETSGSTIAVKTLQMIQLQKIVLAVGMFSLFDSILQEGLSCDNGFREAKNILTKTGKIELRDRFNDFICAINVLKHGRGRSYDELVSKFDSLPFRVRLPEENYEGEDIADISVLVVVDDDFVFSCADLIAQVSLEIRQEIPDYYL